MREEDRARRCLEMARYVTQTGDTVRGVAARFRLSKSLAHRELTIRLRGLNAGLYQEVKQVLSYHKSVRHLRGGEATRQRYLREKAEKVGNGNEK